MKLSFFCISSILGFLFFASCAKLPIDPPFPSTQISKPSDSVSFAVIGDYGQDSPKEVEVASMVKGWKPEFIVTVGDNNYPLGSSGTIVENIGKHYADFIYNPDAPSDRVCRGKANNEKINRFYPSPGNHDNYSSPPLKPYLDYFTLPGDERNYDYAWGPVHFFSLNTGVAGNIDETTKAWLKEGLANSTASFNIVYFHHPPFSPGNHGSCVATQLPFADWGADVIISGHEHFYTRLKDKTTPKLLYLIIGNSGNENLYNCNANPLDNNRFEYTCDNTHFGALQMSATKTKLAIQYFTIEQPETPTDSFELTK